MSPYRSAISENCTGGSVLIPVRWHEVERRGGKQLSKSQKLAEFLFYQSEQPGAPADSGVVSELIVTRPGVLHGMLLYWDLKLLSHTLDPTESISYTTSPNSSQNWQDHWVQVVFPFASDGINVSEGDIIKVALYNDGVNIWLELVSVCPHGVTVGTKRKAHDITSAEENTKNLPLTSPVQCSCGWHLLCGELLSML